MPTTYYESVGSGQTAQLLNMTQDAATSTFVMTVARGTPQVATFRAGANNPGAGASNTGTFTVNIQVTASSDLTGKMTLAVALVRYNSAGTAQATVAVGATQTLTTTGVKTFTASNLALGTWAAGDFLGMTLTVTNTNTSGSAKTVTVQIGGASNTVVVPWTYTPPVNLVVANAAQAETSGAVTITRVILPGTQENLFLTQTPATPSNTDNTYTLGTLFKPTADGQIRGVRVWCNSAQTGTTGALYLYTSETTGTLLASKPFGTLTPGGWTTVLFDTPVSVTAGTLYVTAWGSTSDYPVTDNFFTTNDLVNGNLTAPKSVAGARNGRFVATSGLTYPDNSFNDSSYFVDTIFVANSGTTLAVQGAAQAQTASAPTLVRNIGLTVQNAAQAQTATAPTLVRNIGLTVQNAAQTQTASAPTLVRNIGLAVQNASQAQTAGGVVITKPATLLGEWGFANNLNDTSGNGHTASTNWTPTYTAGPQTNTRAIVVNGATQSINYGRTGLEPLTDGIVSMAWVKTNSFLAGYSSLFTRMRGNDSTRHTISIHNDGIFYMARWKNRLQFADVGANAFADHAWHHVAIVDADDRWAVYLDGVQIAGGIDDQSANTEQAWETAYNWVSADNVDTSGRATLPDYSLSEVRMFQGTMTTAEIVTWMNTPVLAGSGIDLTVANASHAETATAPTLVRNIGLTVANAAQAETATAPTLVRNISLTAQSAAQAETASSPTLTISTLLLVQGAAQTESATSPSLVQIHILTVANASQAQVANSPSLTQVHNLGAQNADQDETVTSPAVSQVYALEVQGASLEQTVGSPVLTQVHNFAVQNANQGQTAGSPVLARIHNLVIQNANQAQSAGSPALTQLHVLATQNARQSQVVGNAVLIVGGITLTIANARQPQTAGSAVLTQVHILAVQSANQLQNSGTPGLTQIHVLAVQDVDQAQDVDTTALVQVHFLDVQGAFQTQAAGNATLGEDVRLLVDDTHQALTVLSVILNLRVAPTAKERRLKIQQLLEELLGSPHVYYQPPPNVKMQYPCIVYTRSYERTQFAANNPYIVSKRYTVTVIDRDPDSDIPDKVAALPMSSFQRFYTADNLNHDVFDLYFA